MKKIKPDLPGLWMKVSLEDDHQSFKDIYDAMFKKLLNFCCYYIPQREVAEDIIAEIFVKCWENRKNNTHVINPETYLFIAVKNQSLKHLQKHSGIHGQEIPTESPYTDNSNPEKELERKELHIELDNAIEKLPLQAKVVFRLIKENGMKYKEVAQILNISPRTVQTQLFRAIAKLRITLATHQGNTNKPDDNNPIKNQIISLLYLIIFYSL